MLNLKALKNSLTEEQIIGALTSLGSRPPILMNDALVFDTVCHNPPHSGNRKLYYYLNSKIFKCYTGCSDCFDIFELISRSLKQKDIQMSLSDSMYWLHKHTKVFFKDDSVVEPPTVEGEIVEKELTIYDEKILNILKFCIIKDWAEEGISVDTMKSYKIRYNPVSCSIIIPHFNSDLNLIGIRQRTLIADEEYFGKYRPAIINEKHYPHPLSYNLYGVHLNKESIQKTKKAIVFEGEKSVLLMDKYDESCAVASCGSSISAYQIKILLDLGVEELVVAFDKEFLRLGDDLYKKQVKSLENIFKRFSKKILISFIFDKWNLLQLKDSPIDRGPQIFQFLLTNRFTLEKE